MEQRHDSQTRSTLLLRLRDLSDLDAWNEFLERYAPKIFHWCRGHGLQHADASDVTQDVLGKLVTALRTFVYDPSKGSFRGWLKVVTNNVIRDLAKSWSRPGRGSGDSMMLEALQRIQSPEAMEQLRQGIHAEADWEILREAEERVRLRVQPHTWQVYLLTKNQVAAAEAAHQLKLPVTDVYVAKSRVLKLLREEIALLNGDQEDEAR